VSIVTAEALKMARDMTDIAESHCVTCMPPTRLSTNRVSHPAFDPQAQHITAI